MRAGLTCIKFFIGFSGRSTTISDLHGRLHYLDQASQHFQTALSSRARPSERGRGFRLRGQRSGLEESGRGGASGIKPVNEAELRGHQETILLQRRVCDFIFFVGGGEELCMRIKYMFSLVFLTLAGGGGGGIYRVNSLSHYPPPPPPPPPPFP